MGRTAPSAAVHFLFSGLGLGWHAEGGIHALRLIFSGALDRHPNLKLLSGHWGELVAGWLDRLDEAMGRDGPNTWTVP
jgi:predicted TIM-barrel fold metal-dependent hydrolase